MKRAPLSPLLPRMAVQPRPLVLPIPLSQLRPCVRSIRPTVYKTVRVQKTTPYPPLGTLPVLGWQCRSQSARISAPPGSCINCAHTRSAFCSSSSLVIGGRGFPVIFALSCSIDEEDEECEAVLPASIRVVAFLTNSCMSGGALRTIKSVESGFNSMLNAELQRRQRTYPKERTKSPLTPHDGQSRSINCLSNSFCRWRSLSRCWRSSSSLARRALRSSCSLAERSVSKRFCSCGE